MLLPAVYFGIRGFLTGNRKFYIPSAIGTLMILMGGSRGALVCVPISFFLAIPFKWNKMGQRTKKLIILLIVLSIPVIFLVYRYFNLIISAVFSMFSRFGLSSRSIDRIISGTFSAENGRDRIRDIVWELVKTGGPFGRGIYGERNAVGQYFKWGYAHNIALEMLCAFGYVGGSVLLVLLGIQIVKTYKRCVSTEDMLVVATFLGTSMKLLFSDSFWYCDTFWALLAIIVIWKKKAYETPSL